MPFIMLYRHFGFISFALITSRLLQNKRNLFHLRMMPTLDKFHRKDEGLQTKIF